MPRRGIASVSEIRAGAGRDERTSVIELHLIGYTEDGDHLVLDLEADGDGRYLVPVDPDLLATLEAVRDHRLATGKPVDHRASVARPEPAPTVDREPGHEPVPVRGTKPASEPEPTPAPAASGPGVPEALPTSGAATTDNGRAPGLGEEPATRPPAEPAGPVGAAPSAPLVASRLSPAQIQARLRAGRSVRAVAREAGVDRDWVERWNEPIRAERERVLADARSRRVDHPRARPLGAAVDRSLSERGLDPAAAAWRVARRDDGRWRVSVRFEERGRARTATWLLDPDAERLRAQSPLASELSVPGRTKRRR